MHISNAHISNAMRLTAPLLFLVTVFALPEVATGHCRQEFEINQQQGKVLSFAERTKQYKQQVAQADAGDVPAIVLRALRDLGDSKTGGYRMRDIVIDRLEESMPTLMRVATDEEDEDQGAAVWAIDEIGRFAEPWLIEALSSDDVDTRHLGIRMMQQNTSGSEDSVVQFRTLLTDEDAYMRHLAAIALLDQSSDENAATQLLIEEYEALGEHKQTALKKFRFVGAKLQHPQPLARSFITDAQVEFRVDAALTLFETGVLPPDAFVSPLTDALDHSVGYHLDRAILYLAKIGPPAKDAINALQRLADTEDAKLAGQRAAANVALCHLDPSLVSRCLPLALPWLAEEANHNANLREELLQEIGRLGPAANLAVEPLQVMFAHSTESRHVDLALTVIQVDQSGPEQGLAMLRKVIDGQTPNPNTMGYHWEIVEPAAAVAPDLAKAFAREKDVDRINQLRWIWTKVLPPEAARSIVPEVRRVATRLANKRIRQRLTRTIDTVLKTDEG